MISIPTAAFYSLLAAPLVAIAIVCSFWADQINQVRARVREEAQEKIKIMELYQNRQKEEAGPKILLQ
jgi:hypothetical protein